MKKYEIKGFIALYVLLFTLLFMVSCRSVDKTTTIEKHSNESSIFGNIKLENDTSSSNNSQQIESQEKLLRELVSSLQLGFNGQGENDKLMVELKQTIDGLKFEVSGNGTANYTQIQTINFEQLKTELLKKQDSLFKQRLNVFFEEFKHSLNESKKVDKEVKVRGFQVGFYALLIISFATFMIGYFVSRYIRQNLV